MFIVSPLHSNGADEITGPGGGQGPGRAAQHQLQGPLFRLGRVLGLWEHFQTLRIIF